MTTLTAPHTVNQATTRIKPRLGFLGVGWIGRNRLEAIAREHIAEVICIADTIREMAEQASAWGPGATITCSYEELLAAQPDGVVIATPSALHAEHALMALEQGAAVFCQKPLGRTAAEAQRLVDAARASDRLLGIDFSYRYLRAAQMVRELVRSGELGRIYAADLVFHNAYGPGKPWFYDVSMSGGGCLIDLGVHLIDLALWMLNEPDIVDARGILYHHGERMLGPLDRVEDYATADLAFGSGATARIACSWNLHAGREAVIEARFFGDKGGAEIRNVNGSFFDFEARRFSGTSTATLAKPPDWWFGRAAIEWTRRLATDPSYDPSVEAAVTVARTIDRIYGRA